MDKLCLLLGRIGIACSSGSVSQLDSLLEGDEYDDDDDDEDDQDDLNDAASSSMQMFSILNAVIAHASRIYTVMSRGIFDGARGWSDISMSDVPSGYAHWIMYRLL